MADVVTGKEQNLRVLRPFRLNGEHIEPGSVISKDEFADKGDWSELCVMTPQTCTQTDDPVTRALSPRERAAVTRVTSPRERAAAPTEGGKSAAMP